MKEGDLYTFISQCKLGVLSSIDHRGTPQSALVGIAATENLEIVFDTVKTSRKYPNLIAKPDCSFVFGWTGEQTVNMKALRKNSMERSCTDIRRSISESGLTALPGANGRTSCIF